MPLHTRPLPSNAKSTLDALIDPAARSDLGTRTDLPDAIDERAGAAPPRITPSSQVAEQTIVHEETDASDKPWYRTERWLIVQLLALVPILGAMLLPTTYRIPLFIAGGSLVLTGTMMLLRHTPAPAARPAPRGE
ncbi:MAG TPA: hypothetical protein VFP90_07525 [Gemmatimonadaceae bacterium]|jgi:hypothetical protein|nr:hypothetical protein [Gemmatimonadaceae bacterium]